MSELVKELLRLEYHPGFPNGKSLRCPVFLQDKYCYLKFLKDLVNPTFKVDRCQYSENYENEGIKM
jgi:hypothetical protein